MRKNKSLIRKFAILSVLLMLFGFLIVSNQTTAGSLPCCRDCLAEEEACALDCNNYYESLPPEQQSAVDWENCLTRCAQMRNYCSYQICDFGCTRPCQGNGDCGVTGCYCSGSGACFCAP